MPLIYPNFIPLKEFTTLVPGAGDMAPWLHTLAALAEDPNLGLTTTVTLAPLQCPLLASVGTHIYKHTYT